MNRCSHCRQFSKNINAKFCWSCGQRLPLEDEAFHLEGLRRIYLRRLHVLERQAAYHGIDTRAETVLEIEELNEKITIFTQQIFLLELKSSENLSSSILELQFKKLTNTPSSRNIKILEVVLATGVLPEKVQLISSTDDTFVLRIQASESIIKQILSRYNSRDQLIDSLKADYIIDVNMLDEENDLYRLISSCQCSVEQKIFNVYFYRESTNYWAAHEVEYIVSFEKNKPYEASVKGTIVTDQNYPGCPYCKSRGIFKHLECGRISCWIPQTTTALCAWCNLHLNVTASISKLDGHTDIMNTG